MFRSAKMLTLMALSTAAGVVVLSPRAAVAQVYIERVYEPGCDIRCYDYAGTLTVDHRSFRISTRCSILDQIEEAFIDRGYDVYRVGRTVRVYKDCCHPDIYFDAGLYDLRVREYARYFVFTVVRNDFCDACDYGSHRDGICYRLDSHGVKFGIRLEFGNHDHELYFHNDYRHDTRDHRDVHRDHRDYRDRDNRGRDDWRDSGEHRSDRDNYDERSGGRTYVTPEREIDRFDTPRRSPRSIDSTDTNTKKPADIGTPATPARRGNKLTTPPADDDRSSTPGGGITNPRDTTRDNPRERVIVKEPSRSPASERDRSSRPGSSPERIVERPTTRPLPVQSPSPAKRPAIDSPREVTKEPSRAPQQSKPSGNSSGQKKDSGQKKSTDSKQTTEQKKDRRW